MRLVTTNIKTSLLQVMLNSTTYFKAQLKVLLQKSAKH